MSQRTFYPPSESDIPMHGWRPYSDMHRERIRAHDKHDAAGGSMERKAFDDPAWLPVLVEEVGEVARVLCDDKLGVLGGDVRTTLRKELVQVGAMTAAWIDAIDAEIRENRAQGGIVTSGGIPAEPVTITTPPGWRDETTGLVSGGLVTD